VHQSPHIELNGRLFRNAAHPENRDEPGHRIILRNHPPSFVKDLGKLPEGAESADRLSGKANVIVYFTDRLAELQKNFVRLSAALVPDGMVWIGWPKKASGRPTDLTEDVVRRVGLECGLVDVKVCAIDETWSGLKFVIRVKDRKQAISK